jgi:hypothetical protein
VRVEMLIGGKWTAGATTFPTYDPGEVIAEVAGGTPDDVDAAVTEAQRAFDHPEWARMTPAARARLLLRLADLLERDADEMAAWADTGRHRLPEPAPGDGRCRPMGWYARLRGGTRDGLGGDRGVHRGQEHLDRPVS